MRFMAFMMAATLATAVHAETLDYQWVQSVQPQTLATQIEVRHQNLPVLVFDQMVSEPGQSQESFVRDISVRLDVFTRQNNYEGCGQIYLNEQTQQYAVQLSTNFAQIACFVPNLTMTGFETSVASIHSHPHVDTFKANAQDQKAMRIFGRTRDRLIYSSKTPGFSPTDLAGGPGYLVDQGQLFYHNGEQQIAQMGSIVGDTAYLAQQTTPTSRSSLP